jgi:hypothetical protein
MGGVSLMIALPGVPEVGRCGAFCPYDAYNPQRPIPIPEMGKGVIFGFDYWFILIIGLLILVIILIVNSLRKQW